MRVGGFCSAVAAEIAWSVDEEPSSLAAMLPAGQFRIVSLTPNRSVINSLADCECTDQFVTSNARVPA
jgi:hypothetical protein